MKKSEIFLPGYDARLPKIFLEYNSKIKYEHKLKKYTKHNIGINNINFNCNAR